VTRADDGCRELTRGDVTITTSHLAHVYAAMRHVYIGMRGVVLELKVSSASRLWQLLYRESMCISRVCV
jgi:hypothetical protein